MYRFKFYPLGVWEGRPKIGPRIRSGQQVSRMTFTEPYNIEACLICLLPHSLCNQEGTLDLTWVPRALSDILEGHSSWKRTEERGSSMEGELASEA